MLDVGGSLGRRFEELNAQRVGKFLALFRRDHTLARQIGLITHQKLVDVLGSVSINLVQPLLYIVEGFLIGDIVDNDNSVGAAIVRRCNGAESFLSGCIPDLELDRLSVQLDRSNFEVNANGGNVGFGVGVVRESKEQTRLTDAGVSNKEQLEQIIAVVAKRLEEEQEEGIRNKIMDNYTKTGATKNPRLHDNIIILHSRNDLVVQGEKSIPSPF